MKKRLVTTILMLAMALSLVACGGNGSDKDSQKPNTENTDNKDDAQANKDTEEDKKDEPVDDGKIEYKVTLVDANGAPIAGKMVQFCNSATCFVPVATDANGVAIMRLEEASDYKAKELTQGEEAYVYFEGATELTITITE